MLRGGPSSEYDVSLKTGAAVLEHLDRERYDPRDIFIDRSGRWHSRGVEASPERALAGIDVAFNTIHGEYGEDGSLHRVLDPLGIAYTGADKLASVLAFNKQRTKELVASLGVKVPYGVVVEPTDYQEEALRLFRSFPHPAIVKPVVGGSSVGVSLVHTYAELAPALEHAAQISPRILVEEFISGREATVGVIDNFRNEQTYALIPVPSEFKDEQKQKLISIAKQVHQGLGLRHFSSSAEKLLTATSKGTWADP